MVSNAALTPGITTELLAELTCTEYAASNELWPMIIIHRAYQEGLWDRQGMICSGSLRYICKMTVHFYGVYFVILLFSCLFFPLSAPCLARILVISQVLR